jgi:regulator of RNase E activity RraB
MGTVFALILVFLGGCAVVEQGGTQNDPDEQVLEQLKAAGSDLSKPHKIEFFLYFPTEEKADRAATEIKKEAATVEVRLGSDGNDWLCFATKEMVPKHSDLVRLREIFNAVAMKSNGEYDGWGTAVVK